MRERERSEKGMREGKVAETVRGSGRKGAASRRGNHGGGRRGDGAVAVGDGEGRSPDMWVPGPACQRVARGAGLSARGRG